MKEAEAWGRKDVYSAENRYQKGRRYALYAWRNTQAGKLTNRQRRN